MTASLSRLLPIFGVPLKMPVTYATVARGARAKCRAAIYASCSHGSSCLDVGLRNHGRSSLSLGVESGVSNRGRSNQCIVLGDMDIGLMAELSVSCNCCLRLGMNCHH